MSDFLCLRFKEADINGLSKVVWSVLAADGRIHASGYSLLNDIVSDVPEAKGTRRNIVIVPSSSVLLTAAHVPTKQQRHLRQMLGFVVEEQIIDPIENMHLATPAYHVNETVHVAAVKRSSIESWLAALEQIGILPDYLFVDVLCVPQKAGDWQLLFEDNKVLFRNALYSGIALDKNTAEPVIRLAIAKLANEDDGASAKQPITTVSLDNPVDTDQESAHDNKSASGQHEVALLLAADDSPEELAALDQAIAAGANENTLEQLDDEDLGLSFKSSSDTEQVVTDQDSLLNRQADPELIIAPSDFKALLGDFVRSENMETSEVNYVETSSELLAVNAVHTVETTLNLLQGEFSPISANAENRRFMRSASLVVAACIGVFLFVTLAGGYYLNYQADQYFKDSVSIYRSVFPKQSKVINPVKQMQTQLSGKVIGGTTSDFLPLLDAASRSLSSLETETPSTITQLRYDTQRGHIIIDLRTQSIDVLESYKDQLTAEGLNVDILSANQDQEMINGRMQIGRS